MRRRSTGQVSASLVAESARRARSYAERLFEYRPIGALGPADASIALTRPAADVDVTWNDDAVSAVVEGSSGYPYFLQEFGKAAWDYAPGPAITLDDAAVGIRAGTESLDHGFFRSRWERVNASERAYMRGWPTTMKAPANPAR
jgi:hypothetical protein